MINIICTDLDGTLLDNQKNLSKTNIKWIKKWQGAGNLFGISSGRQISGIKRIYKNKFQPDFLVGLNGGWIDDIHHHEHFYKISKDHLSQVIKCLTDLNIVNADFTQNGKTKKIPIRAAINDQNGYEKISLVFNDDKIADQVFIQVKELPLEVTRSDYHYIEISEKGRTKLSGVIDAIGKENLVHLAAVGDFYNDIPLIKVAQLGVVVANAVKDAKKVADLIVADNNDNGVADLIMRLMKNEQNKTEFKK